MSFPSSEELDKMYGHVFSDPVVTALCNWREENTGDPVDEAKYLGRAEADAEAFWLKVNEVSEQVLKMS